MKFKLAGKELDFLVARTHWQRVRGLMARKKPVPILFVFDYPSRGGAAIHSFFVFFSFDAVWLDEKFSIIDAKTIRPFTPWAGPSQPAKYLLELPAGTAAKIKGKNINVRPLLKPPK